jgi:NADH-quinone oxidoreductase subunit L
MPYAHTILILALPLMAFLVIGLMGKRLSSRFAGVAGTSVLTTIFALSLYTGLQYFSSPVPDHGFVAIIPYDILWLGLTDTLEIHLGVLIDPLSVMMLVVITAVSLMVHVYSMGYMKGDNGVRRYYAFLSLFTFSMLGLVVATNIFQMYIFWELVGLSSYLLIGFYYDRPAAIAAAKKAFIVTRFADLGFLLGILVLSFHTGTLDFSLLNDLNGPAIATSAGGVFLGLSAMTWAMMLIFVGGAGKSALFPLHIWLPDAMEGPTPVSALIHAATMVVAGVYLVARLFPVFAFSAPEVLDVVLYVGSFTSLFAAVIACTQLDIKRVLAYSTLSQIGYMMVALGASGYGQHGLGYTASLFHLFTHAFFKASLFLGAGSVIHALHTNSMTDMGGLRKYMPVTHITFLIACLAIAGVPPLSGFFSKDEILAAAFEHNRTVFAIQWAVAGLTSFYMFRLYFSIFWNQKRHYQHTPHESPLTMTIPLLLLTIASVFAGFIPFHAYVTSDGQRLQTEFHSSVAIASVAIGLAGIGVAAVLYFRKNKLSDRLANRLAGLYRSAYNKFYVDELYVFITRTVIFNYISRPISWFDKHIVDETMNRVGNTTMGVSGAIKALQSGQLQSYIWFFASGVLVLAIIVLYII